MNITKALAKSALGIQSDYALAKILDCTRAAVGQWPEDEGLPKQRQQFLKAAYPDLFPLEEGEQVES